MSNETQAQKAANDNIRVGKGEFELLRHLNRVREVKYEHLIKHLTDTEAYASKYLAKDSIELFITAKVIDSKEVLKLSTVGKKLLDVVELLLQSKRR